MFKSETWEKSVPNSNGVESIPCTVVVKRYLMNIESSLILQWEFGNQWRWALIDAPAVSFASVYYAGFARSKALDC